MKIKTYRAASIAEALANIKKELGSEAFILGQKEIPPKRNFGVFGKPVFEVTAGVDYTQDASPLNPAPETAETADLVSLTYAPPAPIPERNTVLDEIRELRKFVEASAASARSQNAVSHSPRRFSSVAAREIFAKLLQCGFDSGFARDCLDEAIASSRNAGKGSTAILKDSVLENLCARIQTDPGILPETSTEHPQVIALVGPTGVGKTTTVAKLAAKAALEYRLKVALITNDTYRIAAAEQLRTYAEIMGIPMQVVNGTEEMSAAIRGFADRDVILIDTAGRSQRELEYQKEWSAYFSSSIEVKKALVLSATTKGEDLESVIAKSQCFDPNWIIFTKLDDTEVHGPMVSALIRSGKPLAYVTVGQDVPQDIAQPNATQVAHLALGCVETESREEQLKVGR